MNNQRSILGNYLQESTIRQIRELNAERDALLGENGALKDKVETLQIKVDDLKDEIIDTHRYYMKKAGER